MAITQSQHILPLVRRQRLLSAADVRGHGWSPQLLVELQQSGKLMRVAKVLRPYLEAVVA